MRFSRPWTVCSSDRGLKAGTGPLLALAAGISLVFGSLFGSGDLPLPTSLPPAARELLPKDQLFPVPFTAGETLVYSISWLRIEGGEMTLATSRETTPDGVPVHHIALTAESNDYVSKFYPVRTRYETWVDARDFQPLRFEKRAREGHYVSDEVEEFDLTHHIGAWRADRTPLPDRVEDIISSFYYLRTQPLRTGDEIRVDLFSRGKIYRLQVAVQGLDSIETEVGTFQAFRLQPAMREEGSGEDHNRGKLFVWISDDSRRLPVMAKTLLPIGSVTARLRQISPGGLPAGDGEPRTASASGSLP